MLIRRPCSEHLDEFVKLYFAGHSVERAEEIIREKYKYNKNYENLGANQSVR